MGCQRYKRIVISYILGEINKMFKRYIYLTDSSNILKGLEMKAILKGSKEVRVKLLYIFNWSWTPKM